MRLNSKGQVTIPAGLRHKLGLVKGDEVDVVEDGETLRIVHRRDGEDRGQRAVRRMRAQSRRSGPSTGELMDLLRGE